MCVSLRTRACAYVCMFVYAFVSSGFPAGHIRDRVASKWVSQCHQGVLPAPCSLLRLEPTEGQHKHVNLVCVLCVLQYMCVHCSWTLIVGVCLCADIWHRVWELWSLLFVIHWDKSVPTLLIVLWLFINFFAVNWNAAKLWRQKRVASLSYGAVCLDCIWSLYRWFRACHSQCVSAGWTHCFCWLNDKEIGFSPVFSRGLFHLLAAVSCFLRWFFWWGMSGLSVVSLVACVPALLIWDDIIR